MRGNGLTRYPHLSWLAYSVCVASPRTFVLHEFDPVSHRLIVTEEGDAELSWASADGGSVVHRVDSGCVVHCPADIDVRAIGVTSSGGFRGRMLLVPRRHLEITGMAVGKSGEGSMAVYRDTLLVACAQRLLMGADRGHVAEDDGAGHSARQLLNRLAVIRGRDSPDWIRATSVFTPDVMRQIIERVDVGITARTTLAGTSQGFGLSRSHFARKFRDSTGLSLNRFVSRRRIGLSLQMLHDGAVELSQMSLTLGFASQSHFTRVFGSVTGMSPYQFRRSQFRMYG